MTKNPSLSPLMFVPGMLFWVLLAVGLATGKDVLVGIGVALGVITAIGFIAMKVRASSAAKRERLRLLEQGVRGTATVVKIGTRGGSTNDHPLIDMELDVRVGDAAPRRAEVQALVSLLAIPRVQPGCEIAVHVDPTDPSKVLIDESLTPYGYR